MKFYTKKYKIAVQVRDKEQKLRTTSLNRRALAIECSKQKLESENKTGITS